jgi:hypothetical protein
VSLLQKTRPRGDGVSNVHAEITNATAMLALTRRRV